GARTEAPVVHCVHFNSSGSARLRGPCLAASTPLVDLAPRATPRFAWLTRSLRSLKRGPCPLGPCPLGPCPLGPCPRARRSLVICSAAVRRGCPVAPARS